MANRIDQLKLIIDQFSSSEVVIKEDLSPVTKVDLEISNVLEEIQKLNYPDSNFFSEEKHSILAFPSLIVDPLDGTREFILGRDDWSVSVAYLKSDDFIGEAWIGNLKLDQYFISGLKKSFIKKEVFSGEVSRWEYENGLYKNFQSSKFQLQPKGSIAYKLARLASGEIDFVVSLTPKSIWDVAAGILLCKEAGIHFFSEGKKVDTVRLKYHPPLIWCSEELSSELLNYFSS